MNKEHFKKFLLIAIPFFLLSTAIGYTIAGTFTEVIEASSAGYTSEQRADLIRIKQQKATLEVIAEDANLQIEALVKEANSVRGFQQDQQ